MQWVRSLVFTGFCSRGRHGLRRVRAGGAVAAGQAALRASRGSWGLIERCSPGRSAGWTTWSRAARTCPRAARVAVEALLGLGNHRADVHRADRGVVLKRELLWIPFVGWAPRAAASSIAINRSAGALGGEPGREARARERLAGRHRRAGVPGGHARGAGRDAQVRRQRRAARDRAGARSCRSRTTRATTGRGAAC